MWLFSRVFRQVLRAVALVSASFVLSACSFTPLYGESAGTSARYDLAYTEPASRLEQIIYQDLRLKLGETQRLDAPLVTVSVSKSSRRIGRSSNATPSTIYEVILTGSVSIVRSGGDIVETLYSGKRTSSASYTTNGQVLGDRQAAEDAAERAAHLLADMIRLTLVGALSDTSSNQ